MSYGRRFTGRGGHTENFVPPAGSNDGSGARRRRAAGAPPSCHGRCTTPASCPTPTGSSATRISTSSAGSAPEGSPSWSTPSPPGPWPTSRPRMDERRRSGGPSRRRRRGMARLLRGSEFLHLGPSPWPTELDRLAPGLLGPEAAAGRERSRALGLRPGSGRRRPGSTGPQSPLRESSGRASRSGRTTALNVDEGPLAGSAFRPGPQRRWRPHRRDGCPVTWTAPWTGGAAGADPDLVPPANGCRRADGPGRAGPATSGGRCEGAERSFPAWCEPECRAAAKRPQVPGSRAARNVDRLPRSGRRRHAVVAGTVPVPVPPVDPQNRVGSWP